jgi:hypothetical protein
MKIIILPLWPHGIAPKAPNSAIFAIACGPFPPMIAV